MEVQTLKLESVIGTDEGENLPVKIEYDYQTEDDLLGPYGITVIDYAYKITGKTTTPDYILRDSVEQMIKENHAGLTVEFEL